MASYLGGRARTTTNEIRYLQPLAALDAAQLVKLLTENDVDHAGCEARDTLYDVALSKALPGMLHVGKNAIVARAGEMLAATSRLDRVAAFRPGSELGLLLVRADEWALVTSTPARMETKVRVGDALAAVNDEPVLLLSYEEMFAKVARAKASNLPYTLTFRRAPFHRGWLYKKPAMSSKKEPHRFSGTGWKKRYFVLAYGVLAYYDSPADLGGKHKGCYPLADGADGARCEVTSAPARYMNRADRAPGLMLCTGEERLVLKSAPASTDSIDLRNHI